MKYIPRAITPILKKRVETSKCTLLTGARQVGKSTVIKETFPAYTIASFDDVLTRLQAHEEPNLFFLNNPCPLFIDEVQKEPGILENIKLIVDNSDERGQFILSGSSKLQLMKGVSESLAGRVSISELSGLSLREIYEVPFNRHFIPTQEYIQEREKQLKSYSNIWEIIHKGSYPELYVIDRDWQEFYSSYVSTYIERDIHDLISADSITFSKFLTCLAARTGEILSYTNISSEVGVSEPTIKKWVSVLERTGIIYLLQPYSSSSLSRAIKSPKIYFRDTGLVCYLTKWLTADALKNSAVAGSLFETFIVSEILKSYSNEGEFDFVTFNEISSIEEAEKYIGWYLQIKKDELPPLPKNTYYFNDLLNLSCVDEEGNIFGTVKKVEDFTSQISLRIELKNKKTILIPFVNFYIKKVDLENKIITIHLIPGIIE